MSTLTFKQNGKYSVGCLCLLDGKEVNARKIKITLEVGKNPEIIIERSIKDIDATFEDVKVIFTDLDSRVLSDEDVIK